MIGGGVASAGDLLFRPLRCLVAERVHLVPIYRIEIVPPAFGPDHAALMGAFAVGLDSAGSRHRSPITSTGGRE